jgi:hypothetical protein
MINIYGLLVLPSALVHIVHGFATVLSVQIFPTEQGRHQLGVLGWMRPLEVTPISKLIASDTGAHQTTIKFLEISDQSET